LDAEVAFEYVKKLGVLRLYIVLGTFANMSSTRDTFRMGVTKFRT
jgi:hypothetical protein